jgi:PST family polysaccharide transporter
MSRDDGDDPLATGNLDADLRGHAVRGGAAMLLGQSLRQLVNLGATVALARLLTPQDFGLVGMVLAVTGFLDALKSFGLAEATVRAPTITHSQVSFLFRVNALVGVGLSLGTLVLAPILAWFYREPTLVRITAALAPSFLVAALAVQHRALLRRQMRFSTLISVDLASIVVYAGVAIAAAAAGSGPYALVTGVLAREAAATASAWIAVPWRPSLARGATGRRRMLAFGANLQLATIVNMLGHGLDGLLIGRFWGAAALGLYQRAAGLAFLPLRSVLDTFSMVGGPALSRLQRDPERFRRYYLRAIELLATCVWPPLAVAAALAEPLVVTLLGPQWSEAVPLFRILCLAAIPVPVGESQSWINMALGRGSRLVAANVAGSLLLLASIAVGVVFGPIGVALGMLVAMPLGSCLALGITLRATPIAAADFARALWRPTIVTAALGGGAHALATLAPARVADPVGLASVAVAAALAWLVLVVAVGGRHSALRHLRDLVRERAASSGPSR